MYMATQTEEIWITEDDLRRKLEGDELKNFLAQREADAEAAAKAKAAEEAEKAQQAAIKAEVLKRLGITEDEAKALLS